MNKRVVENFLLRKLKYGIKATGAENMLNKVLEYILCGCRKTFCRFRLLNGTFPQDHVSF